MSLSSPAPGPSASLIDNIMVLPFALSVISLLGSCVVLVTFAFARELRTFLLQPVLLMICFDALTSIGNVVMFSPPVFDWLPLYKASPNGCVWLAAILGNMSQQASILFYLCVVVNMFLTMTRHAAEETREQFRRFIWRAVFRETILVGFYCVVSTGVVAKLGAFGPVNKLDGEKYECWIKSEHPYARLVLYLPLMITMCVATGALLYIWKSSSSRMMPEAWRYTSRRIMLFVVVFLVLWTCPTFFRMHEMFVGVPKTGYPKWLLTTVKCLFGLNGLMNCLVWTTSRPFQVVYERTRCCCCCRIFSDATRNKRGSDDSYLLDEDSLGGAGSATRGGSAVLYRTATEEWSQDKDES